MLDLRCPNCTLAITAPQQVIVAHFAFLTRLDEHDVKPRDGYQPEVFHAGCLPPGWLLDEGPMSIEAGLARVP